MLRKIHSLAAGVLLACGWLGATSPARANVPGGGTNGANVTLTDNGSTVTLANGIVSIVCTKSGATINQINYTYNNGGGTQTQQLLSGGTDGGELYWEDSNDEGLGFSYWVVANPANTGGNYAEIAMLTTSVTNIPLEVHFSMLRGSTGFYTTAMYSHASTNSGAAGMGECRDNIYAGSMFNWMSVDAKRNKLMEVSGGLSIPVQGAPVECYLWTNGIYQGQYEDKYKYSADLGVQRAWGWSSVGTGGLNVGLWNVSASAEYYNGGPMKRELMSHIGTTILNMLNGGHYGMGGDGNFASGEVWAKVYGPYFIYCNNVTNTLTGTNPPAQALYNDALAQAAAEQTAWPYYWFTNANYAPPANRGTVTGKLAINDSGNPNATGAGMWVGLIRQPSTTDSVFDFQEWMKPYQFWTQTDTNGNFTLTNVIAGTNYTLYAYGPGAADTFMSQSQTGGAPPIILDLPASQFAVTVAGGGSNNLGIVTWTPTRVGATVFEIGYPDRKGDKFRHGDDWWVGDIGPTPTAPSPIWSKWLEFPFDFPSGLNYVVGQNRWTTDWNFIQPVTTDSQGNYDNSSSTITFNLASAPTNGATASLYIGLASDYYSAIVVTVNGNNLGNISVTGTPNNSIPTTGYYVGYGDSDTSIREGINGAFSDERLTFSAAQLHAGANTINIGIRQIGGSYFADHAMYDYLRLELTGYVPPPPTSVAAYAGNNCDLVCWPVTPGATSYNVLRSTTPGSGYASITNGVTGPVCGSGSNNAAYLDTAAANGTTYYYEICSVNPTGASTNSPASAGVTPSSGLASTAPAAPTGLSVTSSGHQSVTLNWSLSTNASFYSVWRSILVNTGGGSSNTLSTIMLNNADTGTSYADGSPTDGGIYQYYVTATGPGGTSANSAAVVAVPLPAAPASPPGSLTASYVQTNAIKLNWTAAAGAVGYAIYRATSSGGPYTYLQTVTETTYTDYGLDPNNSYFYQVAAVNAGGVSSNALYTVLGTPVTPDVIPGNAQVSVIWSASPGATNYVLESSTVSGGPYNPLLSTTNTSYLNTGLSNGTTYYYVVYAVSPYGSGPVSAQASATPSPGAGGDYWINTGTASAQSWNVNSNWSGGIFPDIAQALAIVNAAIGAGQTIDLHQAITLGALDIGSSGGTAAFNLAGNGGTLIFDNRPSQAVLEQLSTSAGDTISASVTVNGGLLVTNASANTLTLSGNIAGATNGVTLDGSVTLSGANTFTGGTIINTNTTVYPGSAAANNTAWGSGTNTLLGGTVQFYGYGGAGGTDWGGCDNTFNVPAGQTGTLLMPPRFGYTTPFSSALVGGGTLNVTVEYVRGYFTGNWSAFTGQINVNSVANTSDASGDFRINNADGYANATIYLNNNVNLYNINANGQTTDLGELGGASGAYIGSGSNASTNPTWRIGAKNTTNTYAGVIADSGVTSLIKTGTGTLILTGTNNSYSGSTTINAGTLLANNAAGSATGSGAVTVASGGTLGGTGIISGAVTVNSGGALAPGNPVGTLTVSNSLNLAAGAVCDFNLGAVHNVSNSVMSVTGILTAANNVIHLTAPSLFVGLDTNADYVLFTVSGSISGSVDTAPYWNVAPTNAANFTIVTGANIVTLHYAYSGNTPPAVSAASASPATVTRNGSTVITATVTPGTFPISSVAVNASPIGGPSAVSLVQSNSSTVYTNTVTVGAGTAVGAQTLTVIATDTTTLSGATTVPLTVVAANQVWDGLAANANWSASSNWSGNTGPGYVGDSATFAGTTNLAPNMDNNYSLTGLTFGSTAGNFNLGSAGGHTLTLTANGVVNNSTNAQTLSVPVVLGATQTFNAASGPLTVSGAISGTGGLTKTGSGTLTLGGVNTYTNQNTVSAGTLAITGTVPGAGITTVGNAAGNSVLMDSGTLSQLNLFVGNVSGAVGAVYQTGGTVTAAAGTNDDTCIGNISGAFGYYAANGGTFASHGIAVGGENNNGTGISGTGGNGIMEVNGGTVNDTGWLVMARGVTNETGILNVYGGSLAYAGGGLVCNWGTGQTSIINILGGTVYNTIQVPINFNSTTGDVGILNCDGGSIQADSVMGSIARVNFDGGTLQASEASGTFLTGLASACVYSNGGAINNNAFNITINQPLVAPAGSGVNTPPVITSGGAGYVAPPMVTVGGSGTGATAIAQIDLGAASPTLGQVTNVIITCPGINYSGTPTFALSGGGATSQAVLTGSAITPNSSGGMTFGGSGITALTGASTYTGGTTITGGTLKLLSSAAPSPTPLLYFSFDDVSGSTVINQGSGGSAINGTLTGTATIVSGGINGGNALSIPSGAANAAYVLVNSPVVAMTGSANWTIGMWVKTTTAGGVYAYQGSGSWVSGNMTFYLNEGSDSGYGTHAGGVGYGQGWEQGSTNINDGNWHFLVMTCNGSIKAMYVDGNVDTIASSWASATGVGSQLWIGGSADTGDKDVGLGGLIDGVCMYNSALSQAQIQSLYTNNPVGAAVLPAVTAVTVAAGATLDVGGLTQTIGSLTGPSGSSVILADTTNATGTLTVGNSSSTVFAGTISGTGSLTKAGTGTMTLSGANAYSGNTVVSNGTLAVNNPSGSGTGTGNVTVQSAGTLAGTGAIAGSVTVASGGMLAPGNPLGTLTVGSNLTLAAGCTTLIQVQDSPSTNSGVMVSGSLFNGGTLVVTNTGGVALAPGDSFQLFSAANYAGAFSRLVLPALTTNLVWNTSMLMTSGTISVVMLTSPTIAAIQFNGGSLSVSGSGGVSSWPYVVLATTNLATPQWNPVATNQFDSNGNFVLTLTNGVNGNQAETFYKLQLQ